LGWIELDLEKRKFSTVQILMRKGNSPAGRVGYISSFATEARRSEPVTMAEPCFLSARLRKVSMGEGHRGQPASARAMEYRQLEVELGENGAKGAEL
jgi:hypothetical protein